MKRPAYRHRPAAYLTRAFAHSLYQFVREKRQAPSLDRHPFKEEVRGFESPPG